MRIELTDQQRQALGPQLSAGTIEVVDPVTRRVYMLIEGEVYDRVLPLLDHPPAAAAEKLSQIEPLMLRSMEAYRRDLPNLLSGKSRVRKSGSPTTATNGSALARRRRSCINCASVEGSGEESFTSGSWKSNQRAFPRGEATMATGSSTK